MLYIIHQIDVIQFNNLPYIGKYTKWRVYYMHAINTYYLHFLTLYLICIGATKEIGTALTRMCLRHRAVEARMKTFSR